MSTGDLVVLERQFLQEQGAIMNSNGVYVYQSICGAEILSLDHYLREYKQWLIENKHLKEP